MPGKRVETLRGLARAVAEGRLDLEAPWAAIDAALQTLPGFGPWTRSYLAIRLGRELPAYFEETMRAAVGKESFELNVQQQCCGGLIPLALINS